MMFRALFAIFVSWAFNSTIEARSGRLANFDDYFKDSSLGKVQTKMSGHFKVSWAHPRDEIIVEALLAHLSAADLELAPLFKDQSGGDKKVPVEIFPDLKSFSAVSELPLARFKATGTIALTLDQRLMILSPRNLVTGYSWASTVVHEYVHYLIRDISLEYIPIWLHEGVAQLYQGFPYTKRATLQPSQWGLFKKYRNKKKLLSLETLKEPFPMRNDPEEAELAYIQALLFVQWLDQKCGAVQLIRWSEDLKGVEPALAKCVKMPARELAQKFIPEIMNRVEIPPGSDVEFFARDFSSQDPLEREGKMQDQKSRNFATLSSKLFDQGRYRASAYEIHQAIKLSAAPPPSWQRQAYLALQKSNQTKEAETTLNKLLRDYPEDATGWFLKGSAELARGQESAAWQSFLRSFFVNPFLDGLEEEVLTLKQKNPQLGWELKSN